MVIVVVIDFMMLDDDIECDGGGFRGVRGSLFFYFDDIVYFNGFQYVLSVNQSSVVFLYINGFDGLLLLVIGS